MLSNTGDVFCLSDLQKDLVEYYRRVATTMPLSCLRPDVDEVLEQFYVQPKIEVVRMANFSVNKEILTYSDLFNIGGIRNIYMQGDSGMGKTTYCTKLTLDWCTYIDGQRNEQVSEEQNETDFSGLNFELLFLISLRQRFESTCEVLQMVKDSVLSQLSYENKYDDFLPKALDKERCLIILDGLDEWSHPNNSSCGKPQKHIPHRPLVGNCAYLTLTRPWKLSKINIKDSEIDVLLEISGVKEPKELITKVINCLNRKDETSMQVDEFETATKHLSDLKKVPIVAMQLVCIWHESKSLADSVCGIYSTMLKMMFGRERHSPETFLTEEDMPKCFHGKKWYMSEKEILRQLGKLAFETLLPVDGHSEHVIFYEDVISKHLTDNIRMKSLSVGLLTERKIRSLNKTGGQFCFLHKTFQEFLAAFYVSSVADEGELQSFKIRLSNCNDIRQLFIFLCGLKPSFASCVSEVLMAEATIIVKNRLVMDCDNYQMHWFGYSANLFVLNLVETLNRGYHECIQNKHDKIKMKLTHISYSKGLNKIEVLRPEEALLEQNKKNLATCLFTEEEFYNKALRILKSCKKTIKTLWLPKIDQEAMLNKCTSLQSLHITKNYNGRFGRLDKDQHNTPAPVCLNLLQCSQLEYLAIDQRNISVYIDTDQLYSCFLRFHDLSEGNVLQTITERNHYLKYLFLIDCIGTETFFSRWCHLDLSSCSRLEMLVVKVLKGVLAISINATKLKKCYLTCCYPVTDNFPEEIKRARHLTDLSIEHFNQKIYSIDIPLDLSSCCSLVRLSITTCEHSISVHLNTNLQICCLWYYDLSTGNVLEELNKCSNLEALDFRFCYFPVLDVRHYSKVCIDMSPCRNLLYIVIQTSDILVKYDDHIIGKQELSSWNRPLG